MKQTLKKISFLSLFFFIATFIVGCNDDYEEHNHEHNFKQYKIEKYTYKQASKLKSFKEPDKIIKNELNLKLRSLKKFNQIRTENATARDLNVDFAIDSSLIKQVTTGDITSYTMLVVLDSVDYSDGSFDNLVIQTNQNDETEAFVIHYQPSADVEYNAEHESYNFEGTTTTSKVYGIYSFFNNGNNNTPGSNEGFESSEPGGSEGSVICVDVLKCNGTRTGGVGPIHNAGPGCTQTFTVRECSSNPNWNPYSTGSGGGESGGFSDGNNNAGPGGGGLSSGPDSENNDSQDNDNTTTTTVFPEELEELENFYIDQRQKNFTDDLDWNQTAWLNNNEEEENSIYTYLESQVTDPLDTEYSVESEQFAEEAIIALMNGGELDINNEIIVEESFSNNQKTYCVFQKLLSLSNDSHFKKIIVDLYDSNDKANVIFSIANLPSGFDAVTSPQARGGITSQSLYKITLDQNFVNNASTIEIALTLIHELIHAELLERCMRLGIITNMGFNSTTYNGAFVFNSNGQQISPMDNYGLTFLNLLIQEYRNYSNQSEWNHNLMTGLNYNNIITQNLLEAYPLLNDPSNDFLNNINNDINNTNGAFTLNEAFYFLSWRGLENTQNYINLIQSNTVSLNKKNYIETASNNKFTNTCN